MSRNTPYLLKSRHGIYYFRRVFSSHQSPQKEMRISLNTRSKATAKFLSSILYIITTVRVTELKRLNMEQYLELRALLKNYVKSMEVRDGKLMITGLKLFELEAASVEVNGTEDNENFLKFIRETIGNKIPEESLPNSRDEITVSQLIQIFLEHLKITEKVKNKTLDSYIAKTRNFIEIIGDRKLTSINETTISHYKNILKKLPPNRLKLAEFKKLPIIEAAKLNTGSTLSDQTIRNEMSQISALMNFAVNRKFIEYNPVESMLPKKTARDNELRVSFNNEDIRLLIENDEILNFREDMSTYAYFLMFLGMYSGARINELCSLRSEDFYIKGEEIPYFKIRSYKERDTGTVINPKNENSIRSIPIHPDLKKLGFTDYVLTCQELGIYRIFPELPFQRDGFGSKASKWFTTFKRRNLCNASESHEKKTFHSFRHTFINKLIDLNVNAYTIEDISGHRRQSKDTINANYRDPSALREMYVAISKVSYEIPESTIKKFRAVANKVSKSAKLYFTDKQ